MQEKDPWKSIPEESRLDFKVVGEPLASLAEATVNKIDREWPPALQEVRGAQPLFMMLTKVAITSYETLKYFCAEKPDDPNRRIYFSSSAGPLLRSLADEIYAVVYIVEDIPARVASYYRGGWRESIEEDRRLRERYGEAPDWRDWLERNRERLGSMQAELKITEAELAKPALVEYWPTPAQMKGSDETNAFFRYLDAWFYRQFSQQSHLSYPGLAARGANFLRKPDDPVKEGIWLKARSDAVGHGVILLLAYLTEINSYFEFGLRDRCAYLWGLLGEYFGVAAELHEARYAALLRKDRS
ncbi:MAG: hypothetical protein A3K12_12325 [Candidatus Rokubacteria bacterium RIFCSPLOWO2_12_FULL_71_19]|nr:MAG: hypothetical protein A3K12_12325 [Candidatus Rokubacteria bacterium RIFCSPLOWO2_12_FULL_71_19]